MGTEKNFFRLKFKTAVNMIPQVDPFVGLAKLRLRSFEDVGIIGGEIDFIIYFNYDKINRDRKISSIKLVNNNSYSFMTADDINSLKVNIDVYIDTSNFNIIDIYMLNPSNVSDKESPQCHMHKFEYELEAVSSLENTYTFGDSENENIFVNLIPEELKNGNILIPGSMSPGFKYNTSKPGLNYIEEVAKRKVVGFKNLEFVRFNEMGDSIVRSVNSEGEYGDEIVIKRGLRGFTGDAGIEKPDKPEPPFNVPYGTIVEWSGDTPPEGWKFTLGEHIDKRRYPQMINILELVNSLDSEYGIINKASKFNVQTIKTTPTTKVANEILINYFKGHKSEYDNGSCIINTFSTNELQTNIEYFTIIQRNASVEHIDGISSSYRSFSLFEKVCNRYGMISRISSTYYDGCYGIRRNSEYLLSIKKQNLKLGYIKINKTNASGNPVVDSPISYLSDYSIDNQIHKDVDWYMCIEVYDVQTDNFNRILKLHNKTDFKDFDESTSIVILDSVFISMDLIRIVIDYDDSVANINLKSGKKDDAFFIGELQLGIYEKDVESFQNILRIPTEYDAEGNPKIIYIGQPVELTESSGRGS